jgi:hypothetical protein
MSTQPPAAPTNPTLLPPEERFWRRYSPHQEAPLSGVGSLTLHALAAGALVLLAFLINAWVETPPKSLPITVVPGGGGDPAGQPAARDPALHDDHANDADPVVPPGAEVKRPDLKNVPAERQKLDLTNPDGGRDVQNDLAGQLKGLHEKTQQVLKPGAPRPGSVGRGGPGVEGGHGPGKGPGDGPETGPTGTLTQQQKRMLRWTLRFDTRSGQDYLHQLQALGAILAIPRDGGGDYQYVRDLSRRPVVLADEDPRTARRISWRDEDPRSVGQLMQALGLNRRPVRVEAYFPESLEQKLFELERAHANLREEEIDSTVFDVVRTPNGYAPRVASQTRK